MPSRESESLLQFEILLFIQCLLLLHYVLHNGEILRRGLIDVNVVDNVTFRVVMVDHIPEVVTLIKQVLRGVHEDFHLTHDLNL